MRTILLIAVFLGTLPSAFADCESKAAGEMLETLDSGDPRFVLDYEGAQKFSECKARVMSMKLNSSVKTAEAMDDCKKQALKYAFYDADPKSRDENRKVQRAFCAKEPGVVEDASMDQEAK